WILDGRIPRRNDQHVLHAALQLSSGLCRHSIVDCAIAERQIKRAGNPIVRPKPHLLPGMPLDPRPLQRVSNASEGRALRDETCYAIAYKFCIAANICHHSWPAAKHGLG